MTKKSFQYALSLFAVAMGVGCAGGQVGYDGPAPHVSALSTYEASLGQPIEVFGTGFPDPSEGRFFLNFEGRWIADSGEETLVLKKIELSRTDTDRAVWNTFGPYEIPFGTGLDHGRFEGTIAAEVRDRDGEITYSDGDPMEVTFGVKPSIAVREFQPVTANCKDGEVKRLIGGMPYRMQVESIGFEPRTFTYTISAPGVDEIETFSLRRLANGRFDTLGDEGDFIIPEVPNDVPFYAVNVNIEASDMNGGTHHSSFAMAVRRPVDLFFPPQPVQIAEFYEPQPVEGQALCVDGGKNGVTRDLQITTTESETRSYDYGWNESWQQSITVMEGSSRTISEGVTNGIGFSTTDGVDFKWGWHDTVGGSANGGANFAVVNFGGEVNGSHRWFQENDTSRTESNERTRQETLTRAETTTNTQAATRANTLGTTNQAGTSVTVTESVGQSYGVKIIARHKGTLYTQKTRLVREGDGVVYNQCGEAKTVGKVSFVDWSWNIALAQHRSDTCNPLPKPDLPEPECFKACSGAF